VDNELEEMTPSKGRQLLKEVGVMIFPSLDLNSTLVFDSFLNNTDDRYKLTLEGVNEVYMGTKYNNDENSLMIWTLYPPHKKIAIIDTEKTFGHVMTLKVGETDPLITADIGINFAKLNKAQAQMLIKERDAYKLSYERLTKENDYLKDVVKSTFGGSVKRLTQGESS